MRSVTENVYQLTDVFIRRPSILSLMASGYGCFLREMVSCDWFHIWWYVLRPLSVTRRRTLAACPLNKLELINSTPSCVFTSWITLLAAFQGNHKPCDVIVVSSQIVVLRPNPIKITVSIFRAKYLWMSKFKNWWEKSI